MTNYAIPFSFEAHLFRSIFRFILVCLKVPFGKGSKMREKAGELALEGFRLDPANALLWRGEGRVPLPPKPFEVLCCLAARAGQLVTKEELLDAVWSNLDVSESSLSVSVNALRIALGDDAKAPRYIETIARRAVIVLSRRSDPLDARVRRNL